MARTAEANSEKLKISNLTKAIGRTYWYAPKPNARYSIVFYKSLTDEVYLNPIEKLHPTNSTSFVILEFVYGGGKTLYKVRFPDSMEGYIDANYVNATNHSSLNDNIYPTSPEIRSRQAKAAEGRPQKQGVSIGMSKEEVVASSWGKPQSVNKTTSASGTHEQWVYGGRNFLYFQNGILTTIQN